jgi:hypothetical protein
MQLRSAMQQQIKVDLLKRSIVAAEATRDLADVIGRNGARPVIAYDVLLAQLRGDLARERQTLETLTARDHPPEASLPFIGRRD